MVAIMRAPKRAHAGSRVSLRFMASRRGRAELMIRPMRPHRGDASAASAMRMTAMVRGRGTRFTFRAPERSGPYELELLARTASHQVASAQAEMRVTNGS